MPIVPIPPTMHSCEGTGSVSSPLCEHWGLLLDAPETVPAPGWSSPQPHRAGALTVLGALCSACPDLSVILGSQFCNPRGLYDFQAVIFFFFFPQAKATSVFVWNSNKTSTLWQLDLTMWKEPQLTADRMTENWAKGNFLFFFFSFGLLLFVFCSSAVGWYLLFVEWQQHSVWLAYRWLLSPFPVIVMKVNIAIGLFLFLA